MVPTARMTWDEIKVAYPGEYVVLDDLVIDERTHGACAGRVISHAPTRREALALEPKAAIGEERALKFTGPIRVPPGFVGLFSVR